MFKFEKALEKVMQVFVKKNYVLATDGPVTFETGCMDCSNSCAENCAANLPRAYPLNETPPALRVVSLMLTKKTIAALSAKN